MSTPRTATALMALLAASSCATGSPDESRRSRIDSGQLEPGLTPELLSERLRTSARAFRGMNGGFEANQLAFHARIDADGAVFHRHGEADSALRMTVVGWGRDDRLEPLPAVRAELGQCTPALGATGDCIRRVERLHDGLDEWWVALSSSVEFGFDLLESPQGEGLLLIELEVAGADVETDGETAWLTEGAGKLWTLGSLLAWDADGTPLGTLLELTDDGSLLLVIDDTHARWPIVVDPLLTTAATILSNGSTTDGHGAAIDGAGDVNGDGYDDVVVGAPSGTNELLVYFGGSGGLSSTPDQTLSLSLIHI